MKIDEDDIKDGSSMERAIPMPIKKPDGSMVWSGKQGVWFVEDGEVLLEDGERFYYISNIRNILIEHEHSCLEMCKCVDVEKFPAGINAQI
jgi:hypothetical protein